MNEGLREFRFEFDHEGSKLLVAGLIGHAVRDSWRADWERACVRSPKPAPRRCCPFAAVHSPITNCIGSPRKESQKWSIRSATRAIMIRRYWDQEPSPIASMRYVDEGEQLRGTAGALRLAREQGVLDESFFVIYGDSFLPVEFAPVWHAFQSSGQPALMTVLRNEGRWDRSNAIYQAGRVVLYDKAGAAGMQYIDYGLSCFRRDVSE